MRDLVQSTATNVVVFMADATDHISPKTGLTLTITLSKNGGAFAAPSSGTVTERTLGWYSVALDTTDTGTVGDLILHATATGADPADRVCNVIASKPALLVSGTHTGAVIPTVTALTNDPSKYTHGAVWIDSVNGAAGSSSYVNGIMTNPVTSLADAKSIADNLKLKKFWIQSGSDLTLAAAYVGYIFDGFGYTLALGGRDISGATIRGCETLTGIATSPTRECYVWDSQLGACTFGEVDLHGCHLTGVLTLGAATSYLLANCVGVPTGTPSIDFGSAIGSSTVVCAQWSGPLTIANLKTGDVLHLDGGGDLTLAASCTGGTVYISGAFTLDNSGSGMTIHDTARWGEDQNVTNVTGTLPASGDVTLAASQPNYTPAKAGDAMALTSAYDAAKTASSATAVGAIATTLGTAGAGLTALGDARLANLDASVSTRSTYAGADTAGTTTLLSRVVGTVGAGTHQPQSGDTYARLGAPVGASVSADVAAVADAVWDEALSGHSGAGTAGKKLTDLANADLSGVATATNLATVDTVVDGIATTLGAAGAGLTALGDARLANLDATVSSRLAPAGTLATVTSVTGLTPALVADAVWDEATSGHVGAGSTGLALTSASAPTAAAVADAVWDEALSGHVTAGSVGKALADAGPGSTIVLPPLNPTVFNPITAITETLVISRGDSRRLTFDLGADYTGYTIHFGARAAKTDTAYTMAERTGTWTTIASGHGYVDLTVTDTATVGTHYAEVELRKDALRLTVLAWRLAIIQDVVRETVAP